VPRPRGQLRRKVQLFASETSDKLIAMMAALNPRIDRSAILVSESALVRCRPPE